MKNNTLINDELILKIEELSIAFGGIKAVDGVSFEVKEKEIYGLIGPNGAGKTTIFNIITQFYKPDQGNVFFKDRHYKWKNLIHFKTHDVVTTGLIRTFQNLELIQDLSIIDNLLIGGHTFYKSTALEQVLRLPRAVKEERQFRKRAKEILKLLNIEERADELVYGQPYGILKKVELGRTLMSSPRMIILDEPAAGLNERETAELAKILKQIRDQYDTTIFLVEHDMGLVMDICDRICAISFGKKLAEGTPVEIQENRFVQEAYLGSEEKETAV